MATSVRIVGGIWKRTPLPVLPIDGLRPTPDRVRESLFNWLGQDLTGWRCLDPFAGSGALGFEAASRGAAAVTLIERHPTLVRSLNSVRQRVGADLVTIIQADAERWLANQPPVPQDLILLDPPFHAGWLDKLVPGLRPWLAPNGRIYAESEFHLTDDWLAAQGSPFLTVVRSGRAGQVHYHLLKENPAWP